MDQISQFVPGRAKGFFQEFRDFALQGSLIDLAVAIVIGTAFNAVVQSLVNDVIMQTIAWAFGKPDFSAIMAGPIHIGSFITQIVNFLIVALSVFVVLKFVLRHKLPEKK